MLLGTATGLRSMTGLAALTQAAQRRAIRPSSAFWRSRTLANSVALAAAGEYVADKTPLVPARVDAGPLAGRILLGGLCGAILARRKYRRAAIATGAIAAAGATYLGFRLRRQITRNGVEDLPVALVEDAIAMGLAVGGVAVMRR